MQLGAIVFTVLEKALYMFRVPFASIIRSVLKLYMQSLVQSGIDRSEVRSRLLKDDREWRAYARIGKLYS